MTLINLSPGLNNPSCICVQYQSLCHCVYYCWVSFVLWFFFFFFHFVLRTSPLHGRAWSRRRKDMRSGFWLRSAVWRDWITWRRSFAKKPQIMRTGPMVSSRCWSASVHVSLFYLPVFLHIFPSDYLQPPVISISLNCRDFHSSMFHLCLFALLLMRFDWRSFCVQSNKLILGCHKWFTLTCFNQERTLFFFSFVTIF